MSSETVAPSSNTSSPSGARTPSMKTPVLSAMRMPHKLQNSTRGSLRCPREQRKPLTLGRVSSGSCSTRAAGGCSRSSTGSGSRAASSSGGASRDDDSAGGTSSTGGGAGASASTGGAGARAGAARGGGGRPGGGGRGVVGVVGGDRSGRGRDRHRWCRDPRGRQQRARRGQPHQGSGR